MSNVVIEHPSLPPEIAEPSRRLWSTAEAYAFCTRIAEAHYENFPVGSILVPKLLQPAIHALYAFMRTADDFSDENRRPGDEQERLGYLRTWDAMLTDCEQGHAEHPIFIALRDTLKQHRLPALWLHDLLKAFMMDCTIREYKTFDDVLEYCRYSANPVGRLILTLFGYRDQERYHFSDAICTALQLANHWQDVAVDLKKDRVYLPQEDLKQFGLTTQDLFKLSSPAGVGGGSMDLPAGRQVPRPEAAGDDGFKRLMAFEVERAHALFVKGQPLLDLVQGRLRLELKFTWSGGVKILEKIKQANFNVFDQRPVVTKLDWFLIGLRSLI